MKDQFYEVWEQRNNETDPDERELAEAEMASLLRQYSRENFPQLSDAEKVAALKRDFESDLPHVVLADAIGVDVDLCRRFRYYNNRGVIDTETQERKSIPPSIKDEIRERDGGCVRCEDEEDLTLHHIIPLSQGGMNAKSNYAMLCDDCHIKAHAGNYGSKRMAYEDKDEFWEDFCSVNNV